MFQHLLPFLLFGFIFNLFLLLVGGVMYLFTQYMGRFGYISAFVMAFLFIVFSVLLARYKQFKPFRNLFFLTAITGFSAAFVLGNTFFYNSEQFLFVAKDISQSIDIAKKSQYAQIDLRQLQLDTAYMGCEIEPRNNSKQGMNIYTAVPVLDKQGNRLDIFCVFIRQARAFYASSREIPYEEQSDILAEMKQRFVESPLFKITNGANYNPNKTEKAAVEYVKSQYNLSENPHFYKGLVIEFTDFDPIGWRDAWRIALAISFGIYTLALLRLIPKMIV